MERCILKKTLLFVIIQNLLLGGGKLEIGKNCLLGEYGIYNTFANLIIEDDVITADRISFVTNIHQYHDIEIPIKDQPSTSDDIVIGRGTWIGMNATILGGTHIGKNVVIAAHSVVKGDFPDYCVCGGVPAHIIRQYNIKTGKWEKPYNK
ncbi:acyltransferase [Agathobacter rectalis]|jgi:acetyltransferase-like isoleucine patch superfamily enzyme|uniref:Acyltransferase n=1 Tax=Agathobacter rectalis TaxID=39491 RepID=A0A395V6G1_9FIRM|nr:acyltransferase [Agathobacter rectalis]RGR57231.1 acyltransferase [Agathobacter rectalis]